MVNINSSQTIEGQTSIMLNNKKSIVLVKCYENGIYLQFI